MAVPMTDRRDGSPGTRDQRLGIWLVPAVAATLIVLWLYAPGFGGFWLGDDYGHLHQTYNWSQDGKLWTETWAKFAAPADAVGNFYRPLVFVTLSANFAMFGANYWGWFLTNLLMHIACTCLVLWVVRRAALVLALDASIAAPVAALVYATSPLLVEGVMWVSARSDLAVTAMALLAAGLWFAPNSGGFRRFDLRWLIPLLVVIGLGFKESAAVLPLQLVLLALARPRSVHRSAWLALAASGFVVAAFFAARAWWFDSAWQAYADGGERDAWASILSLVDWWRGAVASAPRASLTWLLASVAAAAMAMRNGGAESPRKRVALALAAAGAGQLLAALLNLGSFSADGDGGRLLVGPVAWFALSLGVLLASTSVIEVAHATQTRLRLAAMSALLAVIAGSWASHARIAQFAAVQREMRALVVAIGRFAPGRTDTTVLVVPDRRMGVVAARNGQGALVMPPLQSTGLLHRVVPTLPDELASRPAQFARGLGTRLTQLQPGRADLATLRRLLEPAAPGPAPSYACWSSRRLAIVPVVTRTAEASPAQLCARIE